MYTVDNNEFRISVRNLVEFMCAEGDIDNSEPGVSDVSVMQEGARIHRKIQHSMGSRYHAEVPLKISIPLSSPLGIEYELVIEGRADGIIADLVQDEDGSNVPDGPVIIDEIKTMQNDVLKLNEPIKVHKAQAMVYGYIFASKKSLSEITIQLTYATAKTDDIKRFSEDFTFDEIKAWFDKLINDFKRWSDYTFDERLRRTESIQMLKFPYEYREGQKNLCIGVYKAIENSESLYIQAPTGVGKTLSTVYPSVMSMGQNMADKIFYLTSKTITRTVAEDTFELLRENGLHLRTVTLTAKDKICVLEERNCNPVECECAKGHFDRVRDAVYDLITSEMVIDRDKIDEYAKKHMVCPFEMSLDVSYWCDGIICDYNYVFDPDASLKRYFASGIKGDYIFLVDEAHNLVDRAREMYSAVLRKENVLNAKKLVKELDKKLAASLERVNKKLLEMKRSCDEVRVFDGLGTLPAYVETAMSNMQKFMEKHRGQPVVNDCLDFFFEMRHFLNMYDCADEKYVYYADYDENGDFLLHLFCVDPSGNIKERMKQGRSTIFFSATLLPVNYFKEMLSGDLEDKAIYAHSSFDPDNKRVIIAKDATSRYTRRNETEYLKVCAYIKNIVQAKPGKYMVFFPSYTYMKNVSDLFDGNDSIRLIVQNNRMTEKDKEEFLDNFSESLGKDESLVGFCVLGGIFSEGIDLKHDSLIGSIIVGTGLPMICRERNILRDYFNDCGKDGFNYAYVIPGMNKVLQAAGRVIRTDTDRGVIVLIDDRFLSKEYEKMFPREWNQVFSVTVESVSDCVTDFWDYFL